MPKDSWLVWRVLTSTPHRWVVGGSQHKMAQQPGEVPMATKDEQATCSDFLCGPRVWAWCNAVFCIGALVSKSLVACVWKSPPSLQANCACDARYVLACELCALEHVPFFGWGDVQSRQEQRQGETVLHKSQQKRDLPSLTESCNLPTE